MIKELNNLQILQTSIDWQEDIPEDLYDKYFLSSEEVAQVNTDKHRWYELCDTVLRIEDKLIGVQHICDVYSENMLVSDCFHHLVFFEMEEIITKSYKRK